MASNEFGQSLGESRLLSRNPLLLVWSWLLAMGLGWRGRLASIQLCEPGEEKSPWAVSVTGPKMKLLDVPPHSTGARVSGGHTDHLCRCRDLGSHGCSCSMWLDKWLGTQSNWCLSIFHLPWPLLSSPQLLLSSTSPPTSLVLAKRQRGGWGE